MTHRLPTPKPGHTLRARCPQQACAGKHGEALAVTGDADGRGVTWFCHRCGWRGGERHGSAVAQPVARPAPRHETLGDWGRQLWQACRPITPDDHAGRYLSERGCALPHPDGDLRWHPGLKHPSGHIGPAMVGLVTDVLTGEAINCHRTWLGDGGRKADLERPRMLLKGHRKAGGTIRLWPDSEVTLGLAVGEGIETMLSLARAFVPVWASIDGGNLGTLPVLAGIEALTVAVDHDAAGLEAFGQVADRWTGAGKEVRRILPPNPGSDLNDWMAGYAA